MSISDLFGKKSSKPISSKNRQELESEFESYKVVKAVDELEGTIEPKVDYTDPSKFVTYGSAYEYYTRAIENIYENYPYDGSKFEKTQWHLTASGLGNHLFENEYPRTNGHITFSHDGWGAGAGPANHILPDDKEYILIKGGPNTDSAASTLANLFPEFGGKSNILDEDKSRESNLTLGAGNTIEFWLKKAAFANGGKQEVIFDMWNSGSVSGDADYGRFCVFLEDTITPLGLTYLSGTAGLTTVTLPVDGADIIDGNWHHYAITISDGTATLYIDGTSMGTTTGTSTTELEGTFNATIGSYYAGSAADGTALTNVVGWNKLSASIDEFRFWKTARTAEQIGISYNTQVFGGTNTDDANTDLGVYYKFNEGIMNTEQDATILDYSGRISNGVWTGYSSAARQTGSAMVLSGEATSEFKDPIIYSRHTDVMSLIDSKKTTGSQYDQQNNSSIYAAMPMWMREEDRETGNLFKLTQIMSSYFDTFQNQVSELKNLKSNQYPSGSEKPYNFVQKNIQNMGFETTDFFVQSSVLERFMDRSEKEDYDNKLNDTKNLIYQNIYNNIPFIMSSKGTEKSFRNLARCFGVDERLLKLNVYSNGESYELKDTYTEAVNKKRMVSMNGADLHEGTVYTQADISASGDFGQLHGTTLEADIYFPKQKNVDSPHYFDVSFMSSSLFGLSASNGNDLHVYCVREQRNGPNAYFQLTSSELGIDLTSSVYGDVYDNDRWVFAVKVQPDDVDTTGNYTVSFQGVNANNGRVENSFEVAGIIIEADGDDFHAASKGLYAGAKRESLSGVVENRSDATVSSVRYWEKALTSAEIESHAIDAKNYGLANPHQKLFSESFDMPAINTLKLHWDFTLVTGSDGAGEFTVLDAASGSIDYGSYNTNHPGTGTGFPTSSTEFVKSEFINTYNRTSPEASNGAAMVNALSQAEEISDTFSNPVNHVFSVENSYYQVISDEILRFFSATRDIASMFANGHDKYAEKYNALEMMRNEFFSRMQNDTNAERYFEYFKWIDDSIVMMLRQVLPAAATVIDGPLNVIESHILERSKHEHKAPTFAVRNSRIIEGIASTAPSPSLEDENSYNGDAWDERILNEIPEDASTGIVAIDENRRQLLNVVNNRAKSNQTFKADELTSRTEEKQTADVVAANYEVGTSNLTSTSVGPIGKTKITFKIS